jgi:phosphoglycolate phosphatase-like HAD superfamily hydrolase
MRRCYVFDIDGTMSNPAHRLHHITTTKPANWPAFFAACGQDAPIPHMVELADRLGHHEDIVFITGRSDDVRAETLAWLKGQLPEFAWHERDDLYMRKAGDHRADTIVKSELMDAVIAAGWTPIMVFEDRASVVTMWRERGIPCCQVADGDF